jgi:hypothetical protein
MPNLAGAQILGVKGRVETMSDAWSCSLDLIPSLVYIDVAMDRGLCTRYTPSFWSLSVIRQSRLERDGQTRLL